MRNELLASTVAGPVNAPVLVLSSSLGTTHDMWKSQMDALAREWRVVRVDHPGHGDSVVWDGPVTVERIGLAVVDLLDRMEVERVSFCGLSLGGAVGQWLAAHAPQRVERLILLSTSAYFAPRDAYVQRAVTVREQGTAAVSAAVVQRWFTPEFLHRQSEVVARYRAMVEGIPPEGYAACCEAVAEFDGRHDLATIAAPTLVIAGAQDPATPVQHAEVLAAGIPDARLMTIDGAAHLANVEQPAAVEAAIVQHLRGTA